MDVQKLFDDLESNNSHESEEAKKTLAECINQTKDQHILHGLMDYYVKTNSLRIIDVLVKVQSPNDVCLLDRIAEWMRGSNRTVALDLLGFIIRKHPTWLYKIAKHKLIKEILKLFQTEKEIIRLMSALLCIITLLPIIPLLVPNFLQDLLEGFGHLAIWSAQNANNLHESQTTHVQIGIYLLFHYLYGMYPNSFIRYLRRFASRDSAIFQSTIRPLLETVRMHPMLVISTVEDETSNANNSRWKEKEPHDIVVECAKLSLDYTKENVEYFCKSVVVSRDSTASNAEITHLQIRNWQRHPPLCMTTGVSSPFRSLVDGSNLLDVQRLSNPLWSPSVEILSTPPPTGTVTHTPTPIYNVSTNMTTSNIVGATGASPPEAAVEATPETTPLKDLGLKPIMVVKSPAVRAVLASSQPSSPARNDQSPFHFDLPTSQGFGPPNIVDSRSASQRRLLKVINDRDQSQKHLLMRSRSVDPTIVSPIVICSNLKYEMQIDQSMYLQQLESPTNVTESTQEDQEVFELTNTNIATNYSDTLQDISPDCGDETEQLPCSNWALNSGDCRTMSLQERRALRNRCINDDSSYLSYGTSPADNERVDRSKATKHKLRVCRSRSWPQLKMNNCDEINRSDSGAQRINNFQANGGSSSPSGDDAVSAATHFKRIQQKSHLRNKCDKRLFECLKHSGTQTLPQWDYEEKLFELLLEQNRLRHKNQEKAFDPYEMLDRCINRIVTDVRSREDPLKDQIRLLHLLLNFERYRREVHAERNRRLLGKSRTVRSLEKDEDRLKDQLKKQQSEIDKFNSEMEKYRKKYNHRDEELMSEVNLWKAKYHTELDTSKQLRSSVDTLQRRLADEVNGRKEMTLQIEALRGELFDMRNEMQQVQYQAELGLQYKQELVKLQTELLAVGEIQVKCRDKLADLDSLKARDEEVWHLQESYIKEIRETRAAFETKSGQFETVVHQIAALQSTNSAKDANFTEQKRLFKSAKEEYDEKLKALERKYEIQKMVIVQMEERIAELYRNQNANSFATTTPESEKTDFISSMDHNSPLSMSLTSNEGLSTSLKSVTEIRNLHALVVSPQNAANSDHRFGGVPVTSSSVYLQQQTSSQAIAAPSSSAISMRRSSSSSQSGIQNVLAIGPSSTATAKYSDKSTRSQNISSPSSSSSSAL